jgi:hypothetical protein
VTAATSEFTGLFMSTRQSSMPSFKYRVELDPLLASMPKTLVDIKAYWDGKRGDRAMPRRADIEPLELREHLGWILITEVVGATPRFRYRLVGSEIVNRLGRDSTKKYLDELYAAADYDTIVSSMRQVVASRRPMRMKGELWLSQRKSLSFEVIDLPLSENGVDVNMILTRCIIEPRRVK